VQSVNGQTNVVVLDADDVGAYSNTNPSGYVDAAGASNAAPVQSVNGQTNTVVLNVGDLNDTNISNVTNGQVLTYQAGDWINETIKKPIDPFFLMGA
jgi:hypothetical protein